MIGKPLRLNTKDIQLGGVQSLICNVVDIIVGKKIIDGNLIKDVEITTGSPVEVPHGLSRLINGYVVVRRSNDSIIWDSESAAPTSLISLNSSKNTTISLWVF